MATVTIGDLWTPAVWTQSMREKQATFPSLFNCGIVVRAELYDQIAAGAGTSANVPFLKDITDQGDEVQVENTAPVTDNGQTGDVQIFPHMNRVTKNSSGALAKQLSGAQPFQAIVEQLAERRLKQRQTTLIAQMRGLFGTAGAANAVASLSAVRLGGVTAEPFIENGLQATGENLIDPDKFIDLSALLGELEDGLREGCILCHPNIKARLRKLDALNFKTTVMPSELPWTIATYRDVPIFTSAALMRAGTNNGYVYDTYVITKGTFGYGEKPQQGDTSDVASLQYWRDRDKNTEIIWDRTRFILGVGGTKWIGNPGNATNGPTNAELQTAGNWSLVYQTANRVGAACLRTNG